MHAAVLAATLAGAAWPLAAGSPAPDDAAIEHLLDRLGYGPRPGDVEAVRRIGLDRYVDQQLHPERVPENPELARRLASLATVPLDTKTLLTKYDLPREAKLEIQRQRAATTGEPSEEDARRARRELTAKYRDRMDGPPRQVVEDRTEGPAAVYSSRQLDEVLVDFWMSFNVFRQGPVKFRRRYERDTVARTRGAASPL